MKKIICQNCYEVIAERNEDPKWGDRTFKYDPNVVDSLLQPIYDDHVMVTLCCPHCGCLLQVKV